MDQPQQRHGRRFLRVGRGRDVGEALEQHLPQAVDLRPGQLGGERFGELALLGRQQHLGARPGLGPGGRVKRLHQPAQQRGRVDPQRMRFVERGERGRRIALQHQPEQVADPPAVGEAEHVADLVGGDRAAAMGDRLVEDRQPVARRSLGRPGDHRQRVGLDLDPFGGRRPGRNGR